MEISREKLGDIIRNRIKDFVDNDLEKIVDDICVKREKAKLNTKPLVIEKKKKKKEKAISPTVLKRETAVLSD